MPSGRPTITAATSEPSASHTCCCASRAKRPAFTAYSRMIERLSKVPAAKRRTRDGHEHHEQQHPHAWTRTQPCDRVGCHEAQHDQQDPEACTRRDADNLVTRRGQRIACGGDCQRHDGYARSEPMPAAHAHRRCRSPRPQRERGPDKTRRAAEAGNISARERASPGRIRFALNNTNGSSVTAAAPMTARSAPSGSIVCRRRTGLI